MNRLTFVILATGIAMLPGAPLPEAAFAPVSPPDARPVATTPAAPIAPTVVVATPARTLSPATPIASQGMRIFIDPNTGSVVEPSADELEILVDASVSDLNTSSKGLVEVASPTKGGGVMVDLQGRFQNSMVQVIDPDGSLRSTCVSHARTPEPKTGEE